MVSVVWAVVWCVFGAPRRVRSRTTRSRFFQAFALPDENCSTPALMKKFKKQPLDGSICLSPPETEFNEQFARQCRYKPPPEFSLTGKVQHHSSPYTDALTENSQDHGWLQGWS